MKFPLFGSRSALGVAQSPTETADGPVVTASGAARIMVDDYFGLSGMLVVSGWRIGEMAIELESARGRLRSRCFGIERPDVAAHFPGHRDALGFVLIAEPEESGADQEAWLSWRAGSESGRIGLNVADANAVAAVPASVPGPARAVLLRQVEFGSRDWRLLAAYSCQADPAEARGYLESALTPAATGHAVICGWAVGGLGTRFWLEDDCGRLHSLESASWRTRRDVLDSVGATFGPRALGSGFVLHLDDVAGVRSFSLCALTDAGVHVLHRVECDQIGADPVSVSRWLFGVQVADAELERHHERVELPLLSALIQRAQRTWVEAQISGRQLGEAVADPQLSVIVPLYGRYDFVESQMLEWVRDGDLRARAELIYVVDDPALMPAFASHMEELHRLYRVPVRWVFGAINRGFSGANNLGAAQARAPYLLFLNSDVFPQSSGWMESMLEVLQSRAEIGALGPRLVFAEGGIQHVGMRFERLEEFGVWINRHPWLGLDPQLDPHRGLTQVPAVTGACMMVRRSDFDAVGGWDAGYLIGDFEDSDLCLKLWEIGLSSAYLPSVQMVHLERQSLVALGDGGFRARVTLWNALRHQRRWRGLIESIVAQERGTPV
ncbi:glycosyltransferase [Lysobacter enzymogenes]|uniref:glycosyltransferase n=1 Tax=Lysobacter enzymogenes TaxID=69 RepID=UPI00089CD3E9|nr:glycosyltransferase [Lysobacter enzymogenes]SDW34968.1 Glycosyltransferase, GT2 family [Lysobacter enzymogenes]